MVIFVPTAMVSWALVHARLAWYGQARVMGVHLEYKIPQLIVLLTKEPQAGMHRSLRLFLGRDFPLFLA